MSKIVGIDLGTTNSGVAIVRNGIPVMLPNGDERITPSVVGYAPSGQWLVGTPARNQYVFDPDNTVRSIKRSMGTAMRVTMGGRMFSPQEVSAFILREMKRIAEQNLGGAVADAVITVPAYFSDAARQATRDAGEIAGFNVRRIINEPTAAALAYGLNLGQDQLALVYDLGGGTFDVSLVELMDGIVEVRASHGNTHLGGDDFDERLARLVAAKFEEQHGVNLREDRRAWARLQRAAEMAKITLSDHPFAWIREEYIAEKRGIPLHLEYEVSRHEFEEAIADLLQQTTESIDRVLTDAGVSADELTQVLMVGGSSRVPAVWELVADYLDTEPRMTLNPEEVVALGAGVQAAIIAGEPIDAILVDVTPYSLGIAVAEPRLGHIIPDRYKVLIHRNTTIPVTKEDVFMTLFPEQDTIEIKVYQGEQPVASQNTLLGNFLVTDLEPEHPGELAQVTVKFDMDVNGILKVTAQDRKTGRQENITVEASPTRLSAAQISEAQTNLGDAYQAGSVHTVEPIVPLEADATLMARAHRLLDSGTLAPDSRAVLAQMVIDISMAQADRDKKRLDALSDDLLEMLFDLESDAEE
ncbi:MAG TPA: Hsp70 family protein [Anaerolineae bacterium]|nr:Hsp70 family protein [Anaerolineae bacterium]HQI83329.1 Hsp70 family protein [Anaerolineae bacterium]